MTSKCFGYGMWRVSDNKDNSAEAQEEQCRAYWQANLAPYAEWGGWYSEASAPARIRMREREIGGKLNLEMRAGDHLVVASLERAFATTADLASQCRAWLARGVAFHVIDIDRDGSVPFGIDVVAVLDAVVEFERKSISNRLKDTAALRRAQGLAPRGLPPCGFKITKYFGKRRLVVVPAELAAITKMIELAEAGWSKEQIRQLFIRQKILTREGEFWSPKKILSALRTWHRGPSGEITSHYLSARTESTTTSTATPSPAEGAGTSSFSPSPGRGQP